jgi:hypothetical protein
LIVAAVIAAAFLTGFLIQYARARNLNRSLETARAELNACERRNALAGVRDLMGLTYLEVNRKNYGLAQQHASRFFERVRELRGQPGDPAVDSVLNEALAARDEIIAALARGDAAVLERVQKIYGGLLEARPQVSPSARR